MRLLALAAAFAATAAASSSFASYGDLDGKPYAVSYDKRTITINGKHSLFLSGAVHPPRGTQAMWDGWFAAAKANGLNMLQVYIFWNYHEPLEGEFDWSNRGNLTAFMAKAQEAKIFINLRIGE